MLRDDIAKQLFNRFKDRGLLSQDWDSGAKLGGVDNDQKYRQSFYDAADGVIRRIKEESDVT